MTNTDIAAVDLPALAKQINDNHRDILNNAKSMLTNIKQHNTYIHTPPIKRKPGLLVKSKIFPRRKGQVYVEFDNKLGLDRATSAPDSDPFDQFVNKPHVKSMPKVKKGSGSLEPSKVHR
jgi:hypothetical protein